MPAPSRRRPPRAAAPCAPPVLLAVVLLLCHAPTARAARPHVPAPIPHDPQPYPPVRAAPPGSAPGPALPAPPQQQPSPSPPPPIDPAVDRVALASLRELVLQKGLAARSRFAYAPPQLRCVGGSASGLSFLPKYGPSRVACTHSVRHAPAEAVPARGANASTPAGATASASAREGAVMWSCRAALPRSAVFGPESRVLCEDFTPGVDDGYVLRGSCRFEYTLEFTYLRLSYAHFAYGGAMILMLLFFYIQARIWASQVLAKRHLRSTIAAVSRYM